MNLRAIFASITILLNCIPALAQSRGPSETVREFYRFSDARSDLFNRQHIESRKRFYTAELLHLFRNALKKQNAQLKMDPIEKPLFGDGLTFAPRQEKCEANGKKYGYTRIVGNYVIRKNQAMVDVSWAYPASCHDQPVKMRIDLRLRGGKWLIDDLVYPDGGSLVEDMRKDSYGGESARGAPNH